MMLEIRHFNVLIFHLVTLNCFKAVSHVSEVVLIGNNFGSMGLKSMEEAVPVRNQA